MMNHRSIMGLSTLLAIALHPNRPLFVYEVHRMAVACAVRRDDG